MSIAETATGRVRGRDGAVRSWLGVPFAASTAGAARWQPPSALGGWIGVRDAFEFGDDAPQARSPFSRARACSEDCLSLNVWSPSAAAHAPVMVWFPGGGFIGGSASDVRTDGARLAAEGVVVVAANYRVGLPGFMAHPELSAESPRATSGNYGLLDQLAALRWVQENIAGFGGDPGRVTAFGCSAGSAAISLLLTLPQSRGLIHRAILQSPGAFRPLAGLHAAEQAGLAIGPRIDDLRKLDWQTLVARTGAAAGAGRSLTGPRTLRPICDGSLVPFDEREAERRGTFADIPLIVGSNEDEGRFFLKRMPVDGVAGLDAKLLQDFGASADEAIALYGAKSEAEVRHRMADVFGDTQFSWAAARLASTWARRGGAKAWRYVLTRRAAHADLGPTHTSELGYVFGTLGDAPGEAAMYGETDHALSVSMRRAWTRFASTGVPGGPELGWPAFNDSTQRHLIWDQPTRSDTNWRKARLDFLDRFFD